MESIQKRSGFEQLPVLPEEIPVSMPLLPHSRVLSSEHQWKAIGDPLRIRILEFIQFQPATAKYIADRFGISPSSIGHHLHVLEAADLVQIVARRSIRGTIANYYTRTATFFAVDLPAEIAGSASHALYHINHARDEMSATLVAYEDDVLPHESFLHLKLSPQRVQAYVQQLQALTAAFMREAPDEAGQIYDFYSALFLSPPALQRTGDEHPETPKNTSADQRSE